MMHDAGFPRHYLSAVILSGNNQMAKFIGRKAILQTALIFDIYQKKKSSLLLHFT